jgi:hypothetical protein
LQPNFSDHWLWRNDTIEGYLVRDVYQLLTTIDDPEVDATSYLIWHKQVPLKVFVLAWRQFKNKLLTKDNLIMRVIQQDAFV